ncbi:MAG TPA: dethiobiotin synthase [Acidimicrobiales bacterium]
MRPDRLVLVCGTGTEVGKTWVCGRLLVELRSRGVSVAARKPAQSFDVDSEGGRLGGPTDAELLGVASGEHPDVVCPPFRSYHRAMAPPMAAEALGLPPFTVADLVEEMVWPADGVQVGVVEMAGGVRSPQASDGDCTDLVAALAPEVVVLVSDAGLGTINAVRMSMDALASAAPPSSDPVVVLDRFDGHHDIHRRNRAWLADRRGYRVVVLPGEVAALADLVGVRTRSRPRPPRPG